MVNSGDQVLGGSATGSKEMERWMLTVDDFFFFFLVLLFRSIIPEANSPFDNFFNRKWF